MFHSSDIALPRLARGLGLLSVCSTLALGLGLSVASAQPAPAGTVTPARPFKIERQDPALDALISPNAKIKTVAQGFGFLDGPVWLRGKDGEPGGLLAVSIIGNVIYKFSPEGHVSLFLDKAGYTGNDFQHAGKMSFIEGFHVLLIGANCTGVDWQGRVIYCAGGGDRTINRLEKDGTRTVLIDKYDGKPFNGPNDVAIAKDGSIFFTDTDVGLRAGINGGQGELPDNTYRWKDGNVVIAVSRDKLGTEPNGIALSPDDKWLYLSTRTHPTDPKERPEPAMARYPVNADGSTGAGGEWTRGPGIGDGMKTDGKGNVWSVGPQSATVEIFAPSGKSLGIIWLPKPASDALPPRNICASAMAFGGDDAKTLYVTACDDVFSLPLKSAGVLEGPPN